VNESGAVFGELSALLDQTHTADVVALADSSFYPVALVAFLAYKRYQITSGDNPIRRQCSHPNKQSLRMDHKRRIADSKSSRLDRRAGSGDGVDSRARRVPSPRKGEWPLRPERLARLLLRL
jgi:hypothetical protein